MEFTGVNSYGWAPKRFGKRQGLRILYLALRIRQRVSSLDESGRTPAKIGITVVRPLLFALWDP